MASKASKTAPSLLPTPWNVYNLSGSPYFQESLEAGGHTPRPLSLFVGRKTELDRLRGTIRAAGGNSTRQAIAGAPGVGKTTLVKELKALALADGFLTTDTLVPILGGDTAESLFGRVLGALYDTIIANRPMAVDNPALRDAQVLVRATRLGAGGMNFSALGVGIGGSKSATVLKPGDLLIDGPRVVRDLTRFVQGSDARGVLLHLNNMENLTEANAARAADILRDLRDPLLMQNGLHFLLVGTGDAVTTVVQTHQQVRNTVQMLRLDPLAVTDVHAMLAARYTHLRIDSARPIAAPVEPEAVGQLHTLFRGDLRGLLKALEDGIEPLLGLIGHDGGAAPRPVTAAELRSTLKDRYAAELAAQPEPKRITQLTAWGTKDPTAPQTQASLKSLWKLSQSGVSYAVTSLVGAGYVVPLPRTAPQPIQYVLSGVSRLIFG